MLTRQTQPRQTEKSQRHRLRRGLEIQFLEGDSSRQTVADNHA